MVLYVAVNCSVLQCVAVLHVVLQCVAGRCNELPCIASRIPVSQICRDPPRYQYMACRRCPVRECVRACVCMCVCTCVGV